MKRRGYLTEQIAEMDNLRLAYLKARRGKSDRREVIEFSSHLNENLSKMSRDIIAGTEEVGDYHYFTIYDPKERLICAAPFAQRVLHHAIMNVCHEDFERFQTDDSFASRPGCGTYYLMIDEYDNFANTILSRNDGQRECLLRLPVRKGVRQGRCPRQRGCPPED